VEVLEAAVQEMRAGRAAVLVTVLASEGSAPRDAGARMLVRSDASTVGTVGGGSVEHRIRALALEVLADGAPRRVMVDLAADASMACGGRMEFFLDPLAGRPRMIVFGAGHVAHATAPLLLSLGFRLTIVDERPEQATSERFPGCELVVAPPDQAIDSLTFDAGTWILVATHGHVHDTRVVERTLGQPWTWLGCLGSRAKVAGLRAHLVAAGGDPVRIARISAPVGLDIGARTPAEIAVSIAAELVRVRSGCTRTPLPLSALPDDPAA